MNLKTSLKYRLVAIAGGMSLLSSLVVCAQQAVLFAALTVNPGDNQVVLNLEVAACEHQRVRGLQGRTSLAEDAGMLFLIDPVDKVSLWMKDTYIALDILFVDANYRIVGLVESATPLSLRSIDSPRDVAAVVEVKAGFIQRSGVRLGQKVHYTLSGSALAHHCDFPAGAIG